MFTHDQFQSGALLVLLLLQLGWPLTRRIARRVAAARQSLALQQLARRRRQRCRHRGNLDRRSLTRPAHVPIERQLRLAPESRRAA